MQALGGWGGNKLAPSVLSVNNETGREKSVAFLTFML